MINRYGVDISYFRRELDSLKNSLGDRTPDELYNYLVRLANIVSNDSVRDYYDGVKEGLSRYAWWKDGEQYVGTCGRTLREALADAERERGERHG